MALSHSNSSSDTTSDAACDFPSALPSLLVSLHHATMIGRVLFAHAGQISSGSNDGATADRRGTSLRLFGGIAVDVANLPALPRPLLLDGLGIVGPSAAIFLIVLEEAVDGVGSVGTTFSAHSARLRRIFGSWQVLGRATGAR